MNRLLPAAVLGILVLAPTEMYSFEVATHRALSEKAVRSSNVDEYLRSQLSLPGGINELFGGMRVFEWVQEGSEREDDGGRFFNHFHNPLRVWDGAGLRGFGGISSILWGQNPGQGFAWQNARTNYFEALTARTKDDRDAKFAATFQALGQLMHHPQDAAVPAHTRNDRHPFFEGFESYALGITGTPLFDQLTQNPSRFDPSILNLPKNPLAPIPIARMIDATDPEQTAASPSAGIDQGLAEYSNGNFLSGDTIFKGFTFPRLESIDLNFPLTLNGRRYYTKIADGETNFFLVAEGTFTETLIFLAFGDKGFVLDPRVYQDYAAKLLPRAVGYSAGLLDYFFRGRLEVVRASDQPSSPSQVRIRVRNVTPGEETGPGDVIGVIQVGVGDEKSFLVSSRKQITLTRDFQDIDFDFGQVSIPTTGAVFLSVVYSGPLGSEEQAVAVGGKVPLTPAWVCRGFCFRWFIVWAPGATLMIEGDGANNSGFARASDLTEDGECQDCGERVPISFTGLTTLSLTAPTTPDTVASFFEMEFWAPTDGFVCLLTVASPQGVVEVFYSAGFTAGFCSP